jgi:hypothetical protein
VFDSLPLQSPMTPLKSLNFMSLSLYKPLDKRRKEKFVLVGVFIIARSTDISIQWL